MHLLDEVTLADDVVWHVTRTGKAAKVLQVDAVLAGDVVFDYSAVTVSNETKTEWKSEEQRQGRT